MPKALETKLRRQVNKKHPNWSKKRKDAYVYGTLRKTGWTPTRKKKKKTIKRKRKRKTVRRRKKVVKKKR